MNRNLKFLFILAFFILLISCGDEGLFVSLEGGWEYRKGFDESWLKEYIPGQWEKIDLPCYLKSIPGIKQFRGMITLRRELPPGLIVLLQKGENIVFRSGKMSRAADFYFNTRLLGALDSTEPSEVDTGSEFIQYLPEQAYDGTYAIHIVLHKAEITPFPCIIGQNIAVGDQDRIYSGVYSNIIISLLFISFYLIIGIYFINIGIRIPKKFYYLYFGAYCLFLSIYNFIYYNAHQLMIITSHLLRYRLTHITMFLTGPIFLLFFYSLYKKKLPLILRIWIGISMSFALAALFVNPSLITILCRIWYLTWITMLIFIITLLIKTITRNNVEAILMITGILILICGGINDFLVNERYLTIPPIELYTSFFAISIFTAAITNRFIRTHKTVTQLNIELEKRVEERTKKLEETHIKLIDTAHKAGMAEVATSILHNMKNILNSMSISCEETIETLEGSKLAGLVKANDLLREHKDEIEKFLSVDPKGKLLIAYYLSLEEMLNDEQNKIIMETEQLQKNIKMIKKIIDTQQEYAKRELVNNELNLEETIDEALRIHNNEFIQAGITVQKQYLRIPNIRGQKSSVILILLNIFKNACTAMEQNDPWNRILTIKTGKKKGEKAYIMITDNGIGITKDDLKKVFQFGFTNQADGHGFGLHACADIINKMGGTITAESRGPGKGATFTLLFSLTKTQNE